MMQRVGRWRYLVAPVLLLGLAGALTLRSAGSPVVRPVRVGTSPSALAVDEQTGRVFVTDGVDDTVTVLDARDGRILRSESVNMSPQAISMDERVGRVYVADFYGEVATLDARSGAVLNTTSVPNFSPLSAVVVDARENHAFVASYDGNGAGDVTMLDARSGALLRTISVGKMPGVLAVDERRGRLFALNEGYVGNAYASSVSVLDTRRGRLLRTIPVGRLASALTVDARRGRVFVSSNRGVLMLDAASGRIIHVTALRGDALAVDERTDRVFVAGSGGLFTLDATSGRVLRRFVTNAGIWWGAAVDARHGYVMFRTARGTYLVDAHTGRLLSALPVEANPRNWAIVGRHTPRIFIPIDGPVHTDNDPTSFGTVEVLNARTGRVLRTITVGLLPEMVAADERTGRVFVVNMGCPAPTHPCGDAVPVAWGWVPDWLRRLLPWLPQPAPLYKGGSVSVLDAGR